MRQINKSKSKELKILSPLMVCAFSDNLESYKFPKFTFNWEASDQKNFSYVIIKEHNNYFMIQNNNQLSFLFVLLKNINDPCPEKKCIIDLVKKLNIEDQVNWFNEWVYIPKALNLREEIVNWINDGFTINEIKEKIINLTDLDEAQVKNLLLSHDMLSGRTIKDF